MKLSRNSRILLYSNNLWEFGEGMLGPLFAIFAEKVGGDILNVSGAWATFLIVEGVCDIGVGKLCDRGWSKEKLMITGYAINALSTFGYLFVHDAYSLIAVQVGIGLGSALASPTWFALYARYEDRTHDTGSWGFARGEATIMTSLAILAGGAILRVWGFNVLFLCMGTVQTIAAFYQATILLKVRG